MSEASLSFRLSNTAIFIMYLSISSRRRRCPAASGGLRRTCSAKHLYHYQTIRWSGQWHKLKSKTVPRGFEARGWVSYVQLSSRRLVHVSLETKCYWPFSLNLTKFFLWFHQSAASHWPHIREALHIAHRWWRVTGLDGKGHMTKCLKWEQVGMYFPFCTAELFLSITYARNKNVIFLQWKGQQSKVCVISR